MNRKAQWQYLGSVHTLEFIFFVGIVMLSNVTSLPFQPLVALALGTYFLRLFVAQPIIQLAIEFFAIRRLRQYVSIIVMTSAFASVVLSQVLWGIKLKTFVDAFIPRFLGGTGLALYIFLSQALACFVMRKEARELASNDRVP